MCLWSSSEFSAPLHESRFRSTIVHRASYVAGDPCQPRPPPPPPPMHFLHRSLRDACFRLERASLSPGQTHTRRVDVSSYLGVASLSLSLVRVLSANVCQLSEYKNFISPSHLFERLRPFVSSNERFSQTPGRSIYKPRILAGLRSNNNSFTIEN